MLNQIRRLWNDDGRGDKDFSPQETKLELALTELKHAADQLSRASTALLDLIHSRA